MQTSFSSQSRIDNRFLPSSMFIEFGEGIFAEAFYFNDREEGIELVALVAEIGTSGDEVNLIDDLNDKALESAKQSVLSRIKHDRDDATLDKEISQLREALGL